MNIQAGNVVGLLHPGEMGAAVGRCLTAAGYPVLWASDGRGKQTAARAEAAGLTDAGTPRKVAAEADVIISVCPPHAALDVAWAVHGFTGLYVDANAISPSTAREVAQLITANGGRYVDGGIIGSPPQTTASQTAVRRKPRAEAPGSTCPARTPGRSTTCSRTPRWSRGS